MSNFINIKSKVLNQPLLLEPTYAQVLIGAIAEKLDVTQLTNLNGEELSFDQLKEGAFTFNVDRSQSKPYQVKDGAALVPVSGSLVAKTGNLRPYSGMTGYDGIKANLDIAFADDNVNEIILMIDSSGGEVNGCFELCDFIYKNRDTKKMTALVGGQACSAAYAIASSCNTVLMGETSTVGSIGVIIAHSDVSKAMDEKGVKVTLLTAGKYKADGNPYEALSDDVKGRIQVRLDKIHMMFAERVAKCRGISVDAVLKTEALTYLGASAIDVGLADNVVSCIDFIDNLSHSGGSNFNLESNMTKEEHEKALASAQATSLDQGVAEGGAAMQTRIKGIMESEEANGRTDLAAHMAYDTQMTVEEATAMLAKSPKEQAVVETPAETAETAAPAVVEANSGFEQAMATHAAPAVEAESDSDTVVTAESDPVAFALQSHKQING